MPTTALTIEVFGSEGDPERLDEAVRGLRAELLEAPVDSVRAPAAGPAPEGSRAVGVAAVGALVVTLKGTVELVEQVMGIVRGWWRRRPEQRSLRITVGEQSLELSHVSDEQQQRLVDEFIRRVAAG